MDKRQAVLCDFGLSRLRHEITRSKTMLKPGLTPRYAAPELPAINDEGFRTTEKGDIYSLSMTIYHFGFQERPFEHLNEEELVQKAVQNKQRPQPSSHAVNLDAALWELINEMWAHSPEDRPNAREVATKVAKILGVSSGRHD